MFTVLGEIMLKLRVVRALVQKQKTTFRKKNFDFHYVRIRGILGGRVLK